jgi:hypothetical protein
MTKEPVVVSGGALLAALESVCRMMKADNEAWLTSPTGRRHGAARV